MPRNEKPSFFDRSHWSLQPKHPNHANIRQENTIQRPIPRDPPIPNPHPTSFGINSQIPASITVTSTSSQSHPTTAHDAVTLSPRTVPPTSSKIESIKQKIKGSAANFARIVRKPGHVFAEGSRHESDISKEIQSKENTIDPGAVPPRNASWHGETFYKRRIMS